MADGYQLTADYVRTLNQIVRWWRRTHADLSEGPGDRTKPVPFQFGRFILASNLTPGSTVLGYPVLWSGSAYTPDLARTETLNDTLGVVRGRGTGAQLGTAVWAIKPHDRAGWEIVAFQPMALLVGALVNQSSGVQPTDETFAVDGQALLQPIGGILDSLPTLARNPFGLALSDNDKVFLFWNESAGTWDAIAPGGKPIRYGKVQGTYTNQSGASRRAVPVKRCDKDGNNVTGDQFNIYTPINPSKDTAIWEDDVLGYTETEGGVLVVISPDPFDDPIGTVKAVTADAAIRRGWEVIAAGRTLKGIEGEESYRDTGGSAEHGTDDEPSVDGNDHAVSRRKYQLVEDEAGTAVVNGVENVCTNWPPWYGIKWIERTS